MQYAWLRERACCPCIIVGIMGSVFCIMGAVFTDFVIVERFTDWIDLAGNFMESRVIGIARILKATADAFDGLKQYYTSLGEAGHDANPQAHLPAPIARLTESRPLPSLEFTERLFPDPDSVSRPLFLAKLDGAVVVVKFPERYCKEGHEILAEANLAPKLHFCDMIVGGRYMVVMDYVAVTTKTGYTTERIPSGALDDVKHAMNLLHKNDLVFGDLRRPNILVVDRTAMGPGPVKNTKEGAFLVDFGFYPTKKAPLSLRAGFGAGGGAVREAGREKRSGFGGAVFTAAVRYEFFPFAAKKRKNRGGGFSLGPELGWIGFLPAAKGRPMSNTVYLGLFVGFYFGS